MFLFVDTCHSGALVGARGDDLSFDVKTSGVYMMASTGATQFSYESPQWGHEQSLFYTSTWAMESDSFAVPPASSI